MTGRHGCTHRGGLGRGMAIQCPVQGLEGEGGSFRVWLLLPTSLRGSRGDVSQKVRPALSCFLPCTLGRTHHSTHHNRRDRHKLGEGLVWGKAESPHKLLAEISTARPFLPCKRATDRPRRRGTYVWGSRKGHLGSQTLSSPNSNNVACLCQEGPKYFVFFLNSCYQAWIF